MSRSNYTLQEFVNDTRRGPYAIGGRAKQHFVRASDNAALCWECVTQVDGVPIEMTETNGLSIHGPAINWGNYELFCAHCGKQIPVV